MHGVNAVTGEECGESSGQVAVEENPHAVTLRGWRDKGSLGELQDCDRVLARDARVVLEELVERMPSLEILNQGLYRHSSSREHALTPEAVRVTRDKGVR